MPNYDYTCEACGHNTTVFQSIKEEALKECPSCHKSTLKRGIGGGNALFQFKGSGFYITDYKDEKKNKGGCGCSGKHTCS